MSRRIFITGTGTDVGKTYVSALILKKLTEKTDGAAYYKAAMSGNLRGADGFLIPGDASFVRSISGIAQPLSEMCPYVYENAVSPHLAAKIEGNPVDLDTALAGFDSLCGRYDYIVTEGSGGICCPLRCDSREIRLEDFVRARDFPCIIVADAGLGTINSVVLTAEYMKSHGMSARGIIFNHFRQGNIMHLDNLRMCEHYTELQVIACVGDGDMELDMDWDALSDLFEVCNPVGQE